MVVMAVAVGLAVGAVLAYLALTTPLRRYPLGVAAGDHGEAVLVTRFSDYADSRAFVDLVGPDGPRWSVDVTPVFGHDIDGNTSAALAGDQVIVIGVDRMDVQWVGALARADGAVRWWTALGGEGGRAGGGRIGPSLLVDDTFVYVIHELRDPEAPPRTEEDVEKKRPEPWSERVDAVSLSDGKLAWSYPPLGKSSKGALDARFVGSALWVTHADRSGAHAIDRTNGQVTRTLPLDQVLCASPRGFVAIVHGQAQWVPLAGAPVPLQLGDVRLGFSSTCGFRGDDVVLTFLRASSWSVARVVLASGQVAWEQVIGPSPIVSDPVVVGATFPRMVPIGLCSASPYPGWCEAIVVDVDGGAITTRKRTPRVDARVVPLLTSERAFLWLPERELLVDIDDHGRPAGSRRFGGIGVRDLASDDVHDGELWLAGHQAAHPGRVPWIAYDLERGAVVHQQGDVDIEDGAEVVGEMLR